MTKTADKKGEYVNLIKKMFRSLKYFFYKKYPEIALDHLKSFGQHDCKRPVSRSDFNGVSAWATVESAVVGDDDILLSNSKFVSVLVHR